MSLTSSTCRLTSDLIIPPVTFDLCGDELNTTVMHKQVTQVLSFVVLRTVHTVERTVNKGNSCHLKRIAETMDILSKEDVITSEITLTCQYTVYLSYNITYHIISTNMCPK